MFHALEDEADAESLPVPHEALCRQHAILFAYTFPSSFERNLVAADVGLYPVPIIVGALAENFLAHHRNAEVRSNEMYHMFGSESTADQLPAPAASGLRNTA